LGPVFKWGGLPRVWRAVYLVDLDGIFVLTATVPMVPELARAIERVRQEAGLSIEELLQGLRE
jgi:hypothetical protein